MTAPSVDADFNRLLNPALRVDAWVRRNANGRRGSLLPDRTDRCPAGQRRTPPVQVLFVSRTGIARSWMAATLLAHYGGRYAQAGFDGPAPQAVPLVVATAMREIDLTPQDEPAIPGPALPRPPDLLIMIGGPDAVPDPHSRLRCWNIPDPEGKPIDAVRAVRDAIAHRVRLLAHELSTA